MVGQGVAFSAPPLYVISPSIQQKRLFGLSAKLLLCENFIERGGDLAKPIHKLTVVAEKYQRTA